MSAPQIRPGDRIKALQWARKRADAMYGKCDLRDWFDAMLANDAAPGVAMVKFEPGDVNDVHSIRYFVRRNMPESAEKADCLMCIDDLLTRLDNALFEVEK